MLSIARPQFDVKDVLMICINNMRDIDLRRRIKSVVSDIGQASADYVKYASQHKMYLLQKVDDVSGIVTKDEMIKLYNQRMVKKKSPARAIYDAIKLLPENDICPFCDYGVVSTLDHVLPKTVYPILSVTPDNLVGCCNDCNRAKSTVNPSTESDSPLHPYFDYISDKPWLAAKVIEGPRAAVVFRTVWQDDWSDGLNARVKKQFELLNLNSLYSKQAARIIGGQKWMLIDYYNRGGSLAVKQHLQKQHESWTKNRLTCWQGATFFALSGSNWYCEKGHGL